MCLFLYIERVLDVYLHFVHGQTTRIGQFMTWRSLRLERGEQSVPVRELKVLRRPLKFPDRREGGMGIP